MPRAKGGPKTRARRKKRLKLAKGQYGAKSRLFRSATESVDKGQQYAYTGRKNRKRDFRAIVDCAHQRGNPGAWTDLWPLHQRAEEGQRPVGSQGTVRHGHQGYRGIRAAGRSRQAAPYPRDRVDHEICQGFCLTESPK